MSQRQARRRPAAAAAAGVQSPPAPLRLAIGDRAAGAALHADSSALGLGSRCLRLLVVARLRGWGWRGLLQAPVLLWRWLGGRSRLQGDQHHRARVPPPLAAPV